MRVFITEHPYTFNLNGAAALSSSHLRFLVKKFKNQPIHVVFLNQTQDFWKEAPDFDQAGISVTIISIPEIKFSSLGFKSLQLFYAGKTEALIKGLFKFDEVGRNGLLALKNIFNDKQEVEFIWCEHLMPVLYLFLLFPEQPILRKISYSHHDFLFKILRIRARSPQHFIRSLLVKKLELRIINQVQAFISGSQSELKQLRDLAPHARQTEFLPCFYPPLKPDGLKSMGANVKIYHLGTAGATANRIGLQFFFEKVFPAIEHLSFTLEFFGNVKDYVLENFPTLAAHPKIIFHGFVLDLEGKIEEGMIHIIPYSGMTGTRTRIAGLARFKPSLIGFKNMQDSYPFLESGINAMVAKDEGDFIKHIETLILDQKLRQKISEKITTDMIDCENKLLSEFKF